MLKNLLMATVASFGVIWLANNIAPIAGVYEKLKFNK